MAFRVDRCLGSSTLALALLLAGTARGADEESGVWWENSFQMEMQGMAMPAQTSKSCLPKSGPKEPPRSGDDSDCTYSDVKHEGAKTSWKVVCTGKNPMTGEGEMTGTKEAYSGKMTMHMGEGRKGGDVVMVINGKRLGGDCDANATKKQVAAFKKQSDDAQAKGKKTMDEACVKGAADVALAMFSGPGNMCSKSTDARAKLKEVLGTLRGYSLYQQQVKGDASLSKVYQEIMGSDPEADKANFCKKSAAQSSCEKTPAGAISWMQKNCPTEMRGIARTCCPGRDFSGVDELWNGICTDYAKDVLGKGGLKDEKPVKVKEEEPKSGKDQAVDKAKGMLKGLFGK
jgi:hypothetical protein